MTPEQAATLKHFRWGELRHPELMSYPFLVFLDSVREEYGWPIVLTSDARTPEENVAAGGVATSRHLVGEAVDIAFPPTSQQLWFLVEAIFKRQTALPLELELVHSAKDSHVHVAFLKPGQASSLLVAAD